MSYQTILFELSEGIARLTLNRPDRLNSFNVEMHDEVRDALGRLAAGPRGARAGAHAAPGAASAPARISAIAPSRRAGRASISASRSSVTTSRSSSRCAICRCR